MKSRTSRRPWFPSVSLLLDLLTVAASGIAVIALGIGGFSRLDGFATLTLAVVTGLTLVARHVRPDGGSELLDLACFFVSGLLVAVVVAASGGPHSLLHPLLTISIALLVYRFGRTRGLAMGALLIVAYAIASVALGVAPVIHIVLSAALGLTIVGALALFWRQHAEARVQLLHVVAHELRNPQAGVQVLLERLQHRLSGHPLESELSKLVGSLAHESRRLGRLLDQGLEALRAQDGHVAIGRDVLDLADVVDQAVASFNAVRQGNVGAVWEPPGTMVRVIGDAGRLEQVLTNLLDNAAKFSPGGGRVSLSCRVSQQRVRVSVADAGIGIPEHQLAEIFEPFFRASNVAGRDPGGLGLGLFICQGIVRAHGGRMWVQSKEGVGSTFHVELPLARIPASGTVPSGKQDTALV